MFLCGNIPLPRVNNLNLLCPNHPPFLSCQVCPHCLCKYSRLICLGSSRIALSDTDTAQNSPGGCSKHILTPDSRASDFELIHPSGSQILLIIPWMVTWLTRKLPLQPVFLLINANAIISLSIPSNGLYVFLLKSDVALSLSPVC